MTYAISVIIPANNEAARIGACLASLLTQADKGGRAIQVVVVPNGCSDNTADVARSYRNDFAQRGWQLDVVELVEGGKIPALNRGDEAALASSRMYLDADIVCGGGLLTKLLDVLDSDRAVYAGARLEVPQPTSSFSHRYARFWQRLPFLTQGVSGAGLFAVNARGRARWDRFPAVIADDAFVRGLFEPRERVLVDASYTWPISEGARALIRVRGRQDDGMRELAKLYPGLMANFQDRPSRGLLLRLVVTDPIGFATYCSVGLATRLSRRKTGWARNR